ncbi:MAG: hypothetical protein HY722_03950 [Planctomycetes bacterium]|nr:hypothetical protein [Planctomycetota bacterium]
MDCPKESYRITVSMCTARQVRRYFKCENCPKRNLALWRPREAEPATPVSGCHAA